MLEPQLRAFHVNIHHRMRAFDIDRQREIDRCLAGPAQIDGQE